MSAFAQQLEAGVLTGKERVRFLPLDPRTKLAVLLLINISVMGTGPYISVIACSIAVTILMASYAQPKSVATYTLFFTLCTLTYTLLGAYWHSTLSAILIATAYWLGRFSVGLVCATYVLSTTGVSELKASLRALHVHAGFVDALTVMLRFFPTVLAELRAILDAMKMRGIDASARGIMCHPLRTGEYILVPLLASVSRIADDLAASGGIRGLGGRTRPSSIVQLHFRIWDACALAVAAALFLWRFLMLYGYLPTPEVIL